jgi:hypothetical protein
MFLFRAQRAELQRLEGEIDLHEGRISEWISCTKNMSGDHKEFTALQEMHRQILSKIPEAGRVHDLAEQIVDLGRRRDCRVTYVGVPFTSLFSSGGDAKPSTTFGGLGILPLRLVVEGRFLAVGAFMESLVGLPFVASFGEVEVHRRSGDPSEVEAEFTIRVLTREVSSLGEVVSEAGI